MRKSLLFFFFFLTVWSPAVWADGDLDPSVHLHSWGVEGDLAWHPVVLIPGTQTTFWSGAEVLYKSWSYFRSQATGNALVSADPAEAAVKELNGAWFLGMAQGLVGQLTPKTADGRFWASPNLVEAYGFYRGTAIHTLSSGDYFSQSSDPDRNGYIQTAFMTGLDLNFVSRTDDHNIKSGVTMEGAFATLPRGIQSVAVDDNRLTGIVSGFIPIYDADPTRRLNTFSVMAGVNMVWDHLWGSDIPAQELQLIGGRSLDGVVGFVEGVGGQVRGVEPGRFDGTDKIVGNLEIRMNLPAMDFPDFARDLSPIPLRGSIIPGVVLFYDYGFYDGLEPILSQGNVTTAGIGLFLQVGNLGSAAIYACDWLTGGALYQSQPVDIALSLGMQF